MATALDLASQAAAEGRRFQADILARSCCTAVPLVRAGQVI